MSHSNIIFNRNTITHVTYSGRYAEYQEFCYASNSKPTNSKSLKNTTQNSNSTHPIISSGGYRPSTTKKPTHRSKNVEDQYKRSLRRIRQYTFNNFLPETSSFVTLTFSDARLARVSNLQECNKLFNAFTKRLNRSYNNFRHVSVAGVQHRRGTLHYHMLCNLSEDDLTRLNVLWLHGNSHIRQVDDLVKCSSYMADNIKRLFAYCSFAQMNSYYRVDFHSRDLNKPIKVNPARHPGTQDIYTDTYWLVSDRKPSYESTYKISGGELVMDLKQYPYDCSQLFPIIPATRKSSQKKSQLSQP